MEATVADIKFEPWMAPLIRKQFTESQQKKLDPSDHPEQGVHPHIGHRIE